VFIQGLSPTEKYFSSIRNLSKCLLNKLLLSHFERMKLWIISVLVVNMRVLLTNAET
jgi:hypothetical protein